MTAEKDRSRPGEKAAWNVTGGDKSSVPSHSCLADIDTPPKWGFSGDVRSFSAPGEQWGAVGTGDLGSRVDSRSASQVSPKYVPSGPALIPGTTWEQKKERPRCGLSQHRDLNNKRQLVKGSLAASTPQKCNQPPPTLRADGGVVRLRLGSCH